MTNYIFLRFLASIVSYIISIQSYFTSIPPMCSFIHTGSPLYVSHTVHSARTFKLYNAHVQPYCTHRTVILFVLMCTCVYIAQLYLMYGYDHPSDCIWRSTAYCKH